jgi:nitrogen fixation protein NifX
MTEAPRQEIARRIALAAKTLPNVEVRKVVEVIQELCSGDISLAALAKINAQNLQGKLLDATPAALAVAAKRLNGEEDNGGDTQANGLPQAEDNSTPLTSAVRIAVASNEGELLNGHFGSCSRFLIYDINGSEQRLVDVRSTGDAENAEDKNAARAALIGDCQVVYFMSVGGPAAAKVIRAGLYPLKNPGVEPARTALARLQGVMATSPPPWLAKILGAAPEARVRFAQVEA